ncbi:response regulator [Candidatus Bathyarchaeota archaeon]|nr:response regulator [Candidatus Bathyarchaeota archaeon]
MQLNILYVEDNPDDHFILEHSLKKHLAVDFKLTVSKTGKEGIENIKKENFDIIILDYKLPDMTGLEILRELRRQRYQKPIIFVTSKGNEEIAVEAMKLGVKDYIVKDNIPTKRLSESINEILLESALPKNIDIDTAKEIYRVLSENSTIRVDVVGTPQVIPNVQIPLSALFSTLDKMSEKGLLKKEPTHSIIACPACNSLVISINVKCPDCGSRLIKSGEAIEHFTCGYIGFESEFEKGNFSLLCPKCTKELKMVGVDYRKISNCYKCVYGHLFNIPAIVVICKKCNKEFSFDQAVLEPIYEYQLSENGKKTFKLSILASEIKNF